MPVVRIVAIILAFSSIVMPVQAWASGPNDLVGKMDSNAPKFQTPECQAARAAAGGYDENVPGRIALGAILGATLGVFGLPIALAADISKNKEGQRVANYLVTACGREAFFPIFMERAKDGDASSEAWIGQAYTKGIGCPKDLAKAVYWYQKAVDDDEDQARVNLGLFYYEGEGVAQDYARAVKLWQEAADNGQPTAMIDLAEAYEAGNGVTQDYEKAFKLLGKAAKKGYWSAQFRLGELHEQGKGVPQSDTNAYKWYSISANAGYAEAVTKRDALASKLTPDQLQEMNAQVTQCQSDLWQCDTD